MNENEHGDAPPPGQPSESKGVAFDDVVTPYFEVPQFKYPDVGVELRIGGLSIHEEDAWKFPCGDIPFYREDGESDEALVQRVTDYLSEILLKYLPIAEGHKKEAARREAALSHITLEEMFSYTEEDHKRFLENHPECAQEQTAEPTTQPIEQTKQGDMT